MITVTEKVWNGDAVEYETKKEWQLKSRFINALKKLPGVSSHAICDLAKNNHVEFEIDGIKRTIDIQPHVELGIVKNDE